MSKRMIPSFLTLILATVLSGCVSMDGSGPPIANPVFIRANNSEEAWERTVDVVHDYQFEIDRENKLGGVIETRYKTGASALEPWHADSVGKINRLQSTLQSIRRKAYIHFTPAPGGYLVGVEAIKELEDVPRAANFVGGATFLDNSAATGPESRGRSGDPLRLDRSGPRRGIGTSDAENNQSPLRPVTRTWEKTNRDSRAKIQPHWQIQSGCVRFSWSIRCRIRTFPLFAGFQACDTGGEPRFSCSKLLFFRNFAGIAEIDFYDPASRMPSRLFIVPRLRRRW